MSRYSPSFSQSLPWPSAGFIGYETHKTHGAYAVLTRVRNRRELHASLKGATLGDADDTDNTLKWIKRNKKKEKELAKKRQEELEQMDKAFQAEYTERVFSRFFLSCSAPNSSPGDLEGLKVSHDFDTLDEGEGRILTLKDSRILDNEGEVLTLLHIIRVTHRV